MMLYKRSYDLKTETLHMWLGLTLNSYFCQIYQKVTADCLYINCKLNLRTICEQSNEQSLSSFFDLIDETLHQFHYEKLKNV